MKMLRNAIVLVVIAAALLAMTACSGRISYANADKYSVGDASFDEPVEALDIDWASGSVTVTTHPGSEVLLTEKTDPTATDDMRVHWWLDGTTLRVRFAAPGVNLRLTGWGQKELTIALPEGRKLSGAAISTASASVEAGKLQADSLAVSTASGNMDILCDAEEITLGSASGSISLEQTGTAALARIKSSSGKISVTGAEIAELNAKTSSGSVSCTLTGAVGKCAVQTASGSVGLRLPENAGYTVKVSTSSGDFQSELPMKQDGKTYVYGDGSAEVSVKTSSGDIHIN